MGHAKAFICVSMMQNEKTSEHRILADLVVAPSNEEALIKATVLTHPSGHDNWSVLSKEVKEVDSETLEQVANEVLGNRSTGA